MLFQVFTALVKIALPEYCTVVIGSCSKTQVTNYQPNTASFQKNLIVNYSPLPLLKQFHPLFGISSAAMGSIPEYLKLLYLSEAISNAKALGSGTSGSATRISVCPKSLNPHTLN
jgi:hypothetical protein